MICFQMSSIVAKNCKMSFKKNFLEIGKCMFVLPSIFPRIKYKLAMVYFNMISYINFLFCLIFTIHTFLCVSIMITSTCSSRCFLFFLVWRQNNPIEEIKRGTKKALLSQLKRFFYNCETRVGICNL